MAKYPGVIPVVQGRNIEGLKDKFVGPIMAFRLSRTFQETFAGGGSQKP